MNNLVPIGRFSTLCRLTVKALRYYDEVGLLRPAMIDADTGYRYYSLAQAVDAERIRLLRSLEIPLDERGMAENEYQVRKRPVTCTRYPSGRGPALGT